MLTLNDAARELGVTAATLRQQIHAGRLEAAKVGPIWVVGETELARYRLEIHGRIGRPFLGRPGYVDTQHVRIRLLFAPADGRGYDALWVQYLSESYVLDRDWTNSRAFQWHGEPFQVLDPETTLPGGRTIELWNRAHVARELQTRSDLVDHLMRREATFPQPVVVFRDGPRR